MNWRTTITALVFVPCLVAGAAAAEVAPNDVAFGDDGVSVSLTGVQGDVEAGAAAFKDRGLGNCLACHANKDMSKDLFHGNVGPSLDGVAERYDEAMLREIVINAKQVFTSETVMPGFYSLDVGKDVVKAREGQTILSAQQVEDVVAYLGTLK
ncbi:monoheme cytochrome SoxX (sulfur oxidation) [Hoeflea marina]|uniref:Monoheme cytochrome SoxX (Sulfur oxidation) n=1 Tax=Hoeflea marina TaxID=274592 RepID=A0A317PTU0_9HYPH|nr:sulfur oxidation c-type cytochrome SoxX [Hoeflea marina]PWW04084.1 monoheme cytochrome SoxX (sulfur oxidation) [Hoeflea marina]